MLDDGPTAGPFQGWSGWRLLGALLGQVPAFPPGMLAAEFVSYGPALDVLVCGRWGVDAYRRGLDRDDRVFIPLYVATLEEFLRGRPDATRLMAQVHEAARQDGYENEYLRKALDALHPRHGGTRDSRTATRYANLARRHATTKFTLLAEPTAIALAVAARRIPSGLGALVGKIRG